MKTIELTCPQCSKKFERCVYDFNRNNKKNQKSFCSRKCSGKNAYSENIKLQEHASSDKNKSHIKNLRGGGVKYLKDSYFFIYLHLVKIRKNKECAIDLNYLEKLWEKQKGKCPYTNIDLKLQRHNYKIDTEKYYMYASLDRIDSSKGYIPGNVEFVSLGINFMKNKFSKESVLDFLELIKKS